ncbi:hypothetical protein ACNQOU_20010, partial [Acinetobacter calcoaceticus]
MQKGNHRHPAIKSFLGERLIWSTASAVEPAASPATTPPSAPSTQAANHPVPTASPSVSTATQHLRAQHLA